jgi:hypothetical protein
MENSVTQSTVGGGCGSTAGEVHGLQVAQQVQGGGDQGGSVGATTGGAGATTGSDNGDAGGARSMFGLGSLAASCNTMNAEHSLTVGNGSACQVAVGWMRGSV